MVWSSPSKYGPRCTCLYFLKTSSCLLFLYRLTTSLEILTVRSCKGSLKFVRLARHTGVSHIRVLRGSLVGFGLHGDLSVPSILDWCTGLITHLSSRPDVEVSLWSYIEVLFELMNYSIVGRCRRNSSEQRLYCVLDPSHTPCYKSTFT